MLKKERCYETQISQQSYTKSVQTDIQHLGGPNKSPTCSSHTPHVLTHLGTEFQKTHGSTQELVQKLPRHSEEPEDIPPHTPQT